MFGIFKLLTKSGRQSYAREAAKEFLTKEKLAQLVADGVAVALEAGAEKLDDTRLAKIAKGCETGTAALLHITKAIDPNGEGGKAVTVGEKAQIAADIRLAVELLVTDEAVDAAIEKAVSYVP